MQNPHRSSASRTGDDATRAGGAGPLLSVDEVAVRLNVPKRWVYERVQRGELPAVRLGRYVRFEEADILAFIAAAKR